MPKYLVLEKSYINNRIYEAGEEVSYDGLPSANLKPLDDEGKGKAVEYEVSNAERVKKLVATFEATPGIDAAAIAAAVAEGLKQAMVASAENQAAFSAEAISAAVAEGIKQGMAAIQAHAPAAEVPADSTSTSTSTMPNDAGNDAGNVSDAGAADKATTTAKSKK
jgi:hypothetical protein